MREIRNIFDSVISNALTDGITNEYGIFYQFRQKNGKFQRRQYEQYNIGEWEDFSADQIFNMSNRCEDFWSQEYAEAL